jgi:Fic family protein
MIVSMRPPYTITPRILKLVSSISGKVALASAYRLDKPVPRLRKENRVRTIHATLKIEGNTLDSSQVTALIENKRVAGPQKDIREVMNAIAVYEQLTGLDPLSQQSFLKAHKVLVGGLQDDAGKYRKHDVGIFQGREPAHIAPLSERVPLLMDALFDYLRKDETIPLVKSCVFHYELEFIHPFADGNGRMGRLWQTLILMREHPVFEFLPFESLIRQKQQEYYEVLASCDKAGNSTRFIEFMLGILDLALNDLLEAGKRPLTAEDRLQYYASGVASPFTRKDYMAVFRDISTATASRDLKKGVETRLLKKSGDKNRTVYEPQENG